MSQEKRTEQTPPLDATRQRLARTLDRINHRMVKTERLTIEGALSGVESEKRLKSYNVQRDKLEVRLGARKKDSPTYWELKEAEHDGVEI